MEPIRETLKRVIKAPSFAERYEAMKNEVLENPGVQQFLMEHSNEINKQVVDRGLGKLYEYTSQSHQCDGCQGLDQCVNMMKGFEPKLVLNRGLIDVDYIRCPRKIVEDDRRKVSSMIDSMYMSKDVLDARLSDVDVQHDSRVWALRAAKDFLNEYDRNKELPAAGLYLHGEFGVGKSYILGALANELAERHIRTLLVYVPEFLREMKQSIQDSTLQEKIDFVKKAPVLMLDDIGAESMSSWTRDEVIGTILHYRMSEKLPTFFTSNFTMEELEHHLAYTQRGEKEVVKAARIMERIRTMSVPIRLSGKNWRSGQ
jgi:primosomal protein DnaI